MSLRLFVDVLDEVERDARKHYVRDGHGWKLDVIGLDEHVAGLKSALKKERQLVSELRRASVMLVGVDATLARGVTPLVGSDVAEKSTGTAADVTA